MAVITAHGNVEVAVRALKLGAFDFISKPLDLGALRKLIVATLKLSADEADTTQRRAEPKLLGFSKPMEELRAMIAKVARSQAPVQSTASPGRARSWLHG